MRQGRRTSLIDQRLDTAPELAAVHDEWRRGETIGDDLAEELAQSQATEVRGKQYRCGP